MNANDFVKTFDLTAVDAPNGSQVNQNLETGEPSDDRGMVLITTDSALDTPVVPDTLSYTRFERYVWVRIAYGGATTQVPRLYAWQPSAIDDIVFLRWVEISLTEAELETFLTTYLATYFAANPIDGADIASNTIPVTAIEQITQGILGRSAAGTGNVTLIPVGTANYPLQLVGTTLQFAQVVTAAIEDAAITAAKLATNAVTDAAIANGTISGDKLVDESVTSAQMDIFDALNGGDTVGSATAIPIITVNNRGRVTAISSTATKISGYYSIPETAIPAAAGAVQFTHGLSAAPRILNLVLICTTTDLGYAVGKEIPFARFTALSASYPVVALTESSDSSLIDIRRSVFDNLYLNHATTGAYSPATPASWSIKGYAYV
jgi:hypothetical protein